MIASRGERKKNFDIFILNWKKRPNLPKQDSGHGFFSHSIDNDDDDDDDDGFWWGKKPK